MKLVMAAMLCLVTGSAWAQRVSCGQPPAAGAAGGTTILCDARSGVWFVMSPQPMTPPAFTLVTRQYSGRITITHGLTADECEAARLHALGHPATDEERAAEKKLDAEMLSYNCPIGTSNGQCIFVGPSPVLTLADIQNAECWESWRP